MTTQAFNTGKFCEKVLALSNYDGTVITQLYQNPINKQKINRGAAFIIKNYFDQYVDSRAKQNPAAYHHIYEFDRVGQKDSRLFKCNVTNVGETAVLSYNFTPAKQPNRQGYKFENKAEIMENNETIIITPKRAKYLKYQLEDGRFVTSEKSIVNNPGGREVAKSFETTFNRFMAGQAKTILEKFGYYRRIEQALIEKRKLVIPRINSGMTANAISDAVRDAQLIAEGVNAHYV